MAQAVIECRSFAAVGLMKDADAVVLLRPTADER